MIMTGIFSQSIKRDRKREGEWPKKQQQQRQKGIVAEAFRFIQLEKFEV